MKRKDKLTLKEMLVISRNSEGWSNPDSALIRRGFSTFTSDYDVGIGKTSGKKNSRLFIKVVSGSNKMERYYYHLPDLGNYTGRDSELLTEYQRILNLIEEQKKEIFSETLRSTRRNLNLLEGKEGKKFSLAEMLYVAEKLKLKDWQWGKRRTKKDKTVWKDEFKYRIRNSFCESSRTHYENLYVGYANSKENLGTIKIDSLAERCTMNHEKNIFGSYTGENPRVLNLIGRLTKHFQKEQKRVYYESLKAARELIRKTEG